MARINLGKVVPEKGVDYFTSEEIAEFKAAIEGDLDTRITNDETQITTNKNDITDINTAMTALTGRVSTNETNIGTNTSDINTLSGKVTTLENDMTTAKSNIQTNTGDISTLNTQQTTQDTNIATNASDIDNIEEVLDIATTTFDTTATYAVGDRVVYNKKIYKCATAITTPGNWDSSNWTEVSIQDLLDEINTEQQEQNGRITQLETDKALLEDLIPTNDAEGESIDLTDSAEYYFKEVTPEGQTSQISTTGKQLFDKDHLTVLTSTRLTATPNDTGVNVVVASGYVSGFTILDLGPISNYANKTLIFTMSNEASPMYKYISLLNCDSSGENKTQLAGLGESSNTMTAEIGTSYTYDRLALRLYISDGVAGQVYHINDILIRESGTTDTWEPYSGGYVSPSPNWEQTINNTTGDNTIKAQNKNFLTGWTRQTYSGRQELVSSTTRLLCEFVPVNANENWYMSVQNTGYCIHNIILFDENKNYISELSSTVGGLNNYGLTIPSGIKYVRTIIRNANSSTEITLSEVEIAQPQLEEGSTATSYIPHAEQTVLFPLSSGQYMAEGDYLADDGIHHVMGEIEFDGSNDENWDANGYNQGYGIAVNNVGGEADGTKIANILCDKLIATKQDLIYRGTVSNGVASIGGAVSKIYIRLDSSITTVEILKSTLNNNPIKVQYPLATETIEPYTQVQQTAWNNIKKLMSYKGVTHISQENDGEKMWLKVVYRKDPSIIEENQDARLDALEARLELLES